jgi:hypothetical protein
MDSAENCLLPQEAFVLEINGQYSVPDRRVLIGHMYGVKTEEGLTYLHIPYSLSTFYLQIDFSSVNRDVNLTRIEKSSWYNTGEYSPMVFDESSREWKSIDDQGVNIQIDGTLKIATHKYGGVYAVLEIRFSFPASQIFISRLEDMILEEIIS